MAALRFLLAPPAFNSPGQRTMLGSSSSSSSSMYVRMSKTPGLFV